MAIILGKTAGPLRPTSMYRRIREHSAADVSQGQRTEFECSLMVLGRKVDLYRSGLRVVHGSDLSPEEAYDSELLRNVHASYYIRQAVGDKRKLWVDARQNPVAVWMNGREIKTFADIAAVVKQNCVDLGRVGGDPEFAADVVAGNIVPERNPNRVTVEV